MPNSSIPANLTFKSFRKKFFAVLGHPISQSVSPFIHSRLFEIANINAEYKAVDVTKSVLKDSFNGFKTLDGFNVTIPHKRSIMPLLDSVSKKALAIGSVNTIDNNGSSKGYNTDPFGFLKSLEIEKIPLTGKVVILGSGGVARAFAYEAACKNCDLIISTRAQSLNSAITLAENIKAKTNNSNITACTMDSLPSKINLLINATPVGMYPLVNEMPICLDVIKNSSVVFDAVYNPVESLLVKTAKSLGIKAIGGLPMLVWQAVKSQEIWNHVEFELNDILQLIDDSKQKLKNSFNQKTL